MILFNTHKCKAESSQYHENIHTDILGRALEESYSSLNHQNSIITKTMPT